MVPLPPDLFKPVRDSYDFVDRNGRSLRRVPGDAYHRQVTLAEMPPAFIQATLAAEDRRFWQHHGVDWLALGRAAGLDLWHGRIVSGGSTITEQLIKSAQPRRRTFSTKLLEALQALHLEREWSKTRILEAYLNRIDYGPMERGCGAAAEDLFGRPIHQLSDAEAALLAGLPQSPSWLDPRRHLDRAQVRQRWILSQMRAQDWLTQAEYERALAEPIQLAPAGRDFHAPHFVGMLLAKAGESELSWPNPVRTTLDLELQQTVELFVHHQLAATPELAGCQAAAVVIDNRDGGVRALVGSAGFFASAAGQVNHASALRQPGSALKPFAYALALERGATAATVLADVPAEFPTPAGPFSPQNYDHRYFGPVRVRNALACSLNVAAVQAVNQFASPPLLLDTLRACGLSSLNLPPEHYGLGLVLGDGEVSLLELTDAYSCLARLGQWQPARLLEPATLAVPPPASGLARFVFQPATAWLIADILHDNEARAPAFGLDSALRFDFPVACKTGTSSEYRDNWAFGYTPEFTVGIWVGRSDGSPMQGVSGVTGAGPILHETFAYLHEHAGASWFARPANLTHAAIDPLSGKRLAESESGNPEPDAVIEWFVAGAEPSSARPSDYDARGRVRLDPIFATWLETAGPAWREKLFVGTEAKQSPLRLIFPLPGTEFVLDDTLAANGSEIELRAWPRDQARWSSSTLSITDEGGHSLARLTPGRHELALKDARTGVAITTWLTVSGP